MAMLKETLRKVCEREKKNVNIMDIAHCTLKIVHALEVILRVIGQNWLDHLGHITEFFKSNAQTVNGGRLQPVQFT